MRDLGKKKPPQIRIEEVFFMNVSLNEMLYFLTALNGLLFKITH